MELLRAHSSIGLKERCSATPVARGCSHCCVGNDAPARFDIGAATTRPYFRVRTEPKKSRNPTDQSDVVVQRFVVSVVNEAGTATGNQTGRVRHRRQDGPPRKGRLAGRQRAQGSFMVFPTHRHYKPENCRGGFDRKTPASAPVRAHRPSAQSMMVTTQNRTAKEKPEQQYCFEDSIAEV